MNLALAVVALAVALDLAQRAQLLAQWPQRAVAVAAAITAAAVAGISLVATPLLDALDVSAPTMQAGAGMVLVLWSAWMLVRWDTEPVPTRRPGVVQPSDAVVPGVFPILLTPVLGVVALAVAARRGVLVTVAPVALGLVLLVTARRFLARRPLRQLGAVVGIVVGIALLADGVLDV
jgi:small neutral amino acid transporter SnatA (MarC family)